LQALYQWQITRQDVDEILRQFRLAQDLSMVDEEFFEQLLQGVIGNQSDLDAAAAFLTGPCACRHHGAGVLRLGPELLNCPKYRFCGAG
jgi:hypothetical protein